MATRSETPGPVLLFPGMGSEAVGMSAGWEGQPHWDAVLEGAEAHTGQPLRRWMREGPESALKAQRHSPHASLAHSIGVFRAHRAAGLALPAAASGYSLGFFSALVAAGVVPLEAAQDLVLATEDLADARFGAGTMGMAFVIGLQEADLRPRLRPGVVLANRNGRASFSLSGPLADLEALTADLAPHCLRAGLLPVRQPLHGPHMAPLLEGIRARMAGVVPRRPDFPLVSGHDGRILEGAGEAWQEAIGSIARGVDWPRAVEALGAFPGEWLECGTGTQLAHLTRWLVRDRTVRSLQSPPSD